MPPQSPAIAVTVVYHPWGRVISPVAAEVEAGTPGFLVFVPLGHVILLTVCGPGELGELKRGAI